MNFLCTVTRRFPENYHIGVKAGVWPLALLIAAGSVQAQEARTLRYGFQPGDVLHYAIEMGMIFTAGETRNEETIRGIETLVVTARDGEAITVLPVASGLRIAELAIHGQDLNAYAEAHGSMNDPFFGSSLRFESPSELPPNLPLGKVIARFSSTGSAPPEAMVSRFWSPLLPIGEYLQNYATAIAYPWAVLPAEDVTTDDVWIHTFPGADDTFHYAYAGAVEESEIPCDLVRGSLFVPPAIASNWGATKGTDVHTALCLAREGGFPVTEEFRSLSRGDVGENEQSIRATLIARHRLDALGLGIVREAADTTFPALGPPGSDAFEDLLDRPAPDLVIRHGDGASSRLSDFAGRVVVAHFWAPWSAVGTQTLAALLAAHPDFDPADVVWLPILVEDEASRLLGLSSVVLAQLDPTIVGYRPDMSHLPAFHANSIVPVTVIVDREGIVRKAYTSYVGESEIRSALAAILTSGSAP